jgi:hypothetical protein
VTPLPLNENLRKGDIKEMAAKKKTEKVVEFKKPAEPMMQIPTLTLKAMLESVDAGNWAAAILIANELREIGEDQGQFPMPPHRKG